VRSCSLSDESFIRIAAACPKTTFVIIIYLSFIIVIFCYLFLIIKY
jgi:hypothetical protein